MKYKSQKEYEEKQRLKGFTRMSVWIPDTFEARKKLSMQADKLRKAHEKEKEKYNRKAKRGEL